MRKEKEMPEAEKQNVIKEFNFMKGIWVAVFAGVMSACMAFAFAAGAPISDAAKAIAEGANGFGSFLGAACADYRAVRRFHHQLRLVHVPQRKEQNLQKLPQRRRFFAGP